MTIDISAHVHTAKPPAVTVKDLGSHCVYAQIEFPDGANFIFYFPTAQAAEAMAQGFATAAGLTVLTRTAGPSGKETTWTKFNPFEDDDTLRDLDEDLQALMDRDRG